MRNLLYISYGEGPHELEVIFSILSVWKWTPPGSAGLQVLVYTDRPERFAGLPVRIEMIPPALWAEWSGPFGFNHRRKILALEHALLKFGVPTVLLDGDTWLRRPIQTLFERIGPGRSVMHLCEGRISKLRSTAIEALASLFDAPGFVNPGGSEIGIPTDAGIWNAGVIGMHPSDHGLLKLVRQFTDELCSVSTIHILEQFAFSHILSARTKLRVSEDAVFHYWPPYLREPFKKILPDILRATEHLPLPERAATSYEARPRPNPLRRCKVVLKRCLQYSGLLRGRVRVSEW